MAAVRVVPGDEVGSAVLRRPGRGTYLDGDRIRSALLGDPMTDEASGEVHVLSARPGLGREPAIEVGDVVLGRVTRVTNSQVTVELLAVNDQRLGSRFLGCIKREDVRLLEEESLVLHECFRLGDVVRAVVLSLGDARQYFLSTAEAQYGVRFALSREGNLLTPLSWKEMEDPVTRQREKRKVAKP